MVFPQEYEKLKKINLSDLKNDLNEQLELLKEKIHLVESIEFINYIETLVQKGALTKMGDSLGFYRKDESRISEDIVEIYMVKNNKLLFDLKGETIENIQKKLNQSIDLINHNNFKYVGDKVIIPIDEHLSLGLYQFLLNDKLRATIAYNELDNLLPQYSKNNINSKPKL